MSDPLCSTCTAIDFLDLFARIPQHRDRYHLGSLSTLSTRGPSCSFCQFASSTIRMQWPTGGLGTPPKDEETVDCTLCSFSAISHIAHESRDKFRIALAVTTPSQRQLQDGNAVWVYIAADDADKVKTTGPWGMTASEFYYGQRLLEPKANLEVLKGWMKRCEAIHGKYPTQAMEAEVAQIGDRPVTAMRLVDVHRMCIVDAKDLRSGVEYASLSYVWGNVEVFRTVKQNLRGLQVPGGLEMVVLPATIRDAITLVREIDMDYLWVDTLCIVQDDNEDKKVQIHNMNSVYEHASLMIAATAGTANTGIPGIGETPRTVAQSSAVVKGIRLMSSMDIKSEFPPWSSRGWTFQEWLMSRRMVIFFAEQFNFTCRIGGVFEDHVYETDVVAQSHTALGNPEPDVRGFMPHFGPASEFHLFNDYYDYVCEYTGRSLTYQSDALDAFEGIITHLMETYESDFYYGMPVRFFEHALLWQPKVTLERRLCSTDGFPDPMFPSWSWSGWLGGISSYHMQQEDEILAEAELTSAKDDDQSTTCEVEKKKSERVQYYRAATNLLQTELTKKASDGGPPCCTKTHYKSTNDYFLSIDTTTASLTMDVNTPFSTPATDPRTEKVGNWQCRAFCYTILDNDGIPCGLVPITDEAYFDTTIKPNGGKGEFIQLSRTRRLPSWAIASRSKEIFAEYRTKHETLLVNVMLVTYTEGGGGGGGPVRRVGVGQVWADVWEKSRGAGRTVVLK